MMDARMMEICEPSTTHLPVTYDAIILLVAPEHKMPN